ncbi:hypothetical protein ACIRQQ_22185 [Streptomyces fuscichromogenes]
MPVTNLDGEAERGYVGIAHACTIAVVDLLADRAPAVRTTLLRPAPTEP